MRLVFDLGDDLFTADEACKAAGVTPNRLSLWIHRGVFRSVQDLANRRSAGDPRVFIPRDVLRMAILRRLGDFGVPLPHAWMVAKEFSGADPVSEPAFLVLTQRQDGGFDARSVGNASEVSRIVTPGGIGVRPVSMVIALDPIREELSNALGECRKGRLFNAVELLGTQPDQRGER